MPFSEEDKYLIQFYRKTKHLGAHRIIKLQTLQKRNGH